MPVAWALAVEQTVGWLWSCCRNFRPVMGLAEVTALEELCWHWVLARATRPWWPGLASPVRASQELGPASELVTLAALDR